MKIPNFKEFVNEYSSFRKKEMHAGEQPQGEYYEVEGGELVDVEDYDKYEHGKIINHYDKNGKKK